MDVSALTASQNSLSPVVLPDSRAALKISTKAPVLRYEQMVRFNYWQEGHIREGLTLWGDLFRMVVEFEQTHYPEAIRVADDLRQRGRQSVVTISDSTLAVWVNLRSRDSRQRPAPETAL